MAFQIKSPNCLVVIGDERLFELPEELDLSLEKISYLCERYYDSPVLRDDGSIRKLKTELQLLLQTYTAVRREQIGAEKQVQAKDPKIRNQILDSLVSGDKTKKLVEQLIELCDDALEESQPIYCSSD